MTWLIYLTIGFAAISFGATLGLCLGRILEAADDADEANGHGS
jgi:hypothetical protein